MLLVIIAMKMDVSIYSIYEYNASFYLTVQLIHILKLSIYLSILLSPNNRILGKLSFSKYTCSKSVDLDNYPDEPVIYNPDEKGVIVCGTVGEIQSDPTYGVSNTFDAPVGGSKRGISTNLHVGGIYGGQKSTIWANIALEERDQLRQRMAWALYQIIPIGKPDTWDSSNSEVRVFFFYCFLDCFHGTLCHTHRSFHYSSIHILL